MPNLTTEQKMAVNHECGNILISASAGSGKTHTMIERIKRLMLQKNVSVNEILCVTFTEKAAFEMKEKLKNALKDNFDSEDRQRLIKEVVELSTADICTLHAFCGRLIRTYFYMVGVAPDFSILDQNQANTYSNECLEKVMRSCYESGEDWFYQLVDRHDSGRSDKRLRELVLQVYSYYVSEPFFEQQMIRHKDFCSKQGFDQILLEYKKTLDTELELILEKAKECLIVFNDYELVKACNFTKTLINDINSVLNDNDVYAVKKHQDYSLKLDFERKLEQDALDCKEVVKECRERFKKIINKYCKHLTSYEQDLQKIITSSTHADGIIKLVNLFNQEYSSLKREENALDFNDLEHFALKILSDEQTRESVKEKYQYVFVDEYQDINAVQEYIINLVSNDNLYMVGDVKQSIYGFRGCRPEFFSNKFESMKESGQNVLTLNHNFRSASAIINMVNVIFDFCMTKEYFGYEYKDTSRLIAGADWAKENQGRAQIHFIKKGEKKKTESELPEVYDVLKRAKVTEQDDNATASLVTKIIDEELGKTYYDFKQGEHKRVELKDVVILTRKNTAFVASLVKGLNRHGFSVSSSVKENACDFAEIDVMINVLKAIDCFEQSVPLATVMKSPIGNFTNEDFFEIVSFYEQERKEKTSWNFVDAYKFYIENASTPLREKVVSFNEYFGKIRVLADFVGAKSILEKLIYENGIRSYLLSQPLGQAKVNRLNRFVDQSVVGEKKLTVKEFLYKIENSPQAFEFSDGASDNQSIKIMTIHASKGLEFPVVIVCGLDKAFNTDEEHDDVLLDRNYGVGVRYYDDKNRLKSETPVRGVIKESIKRERIKEEMRLFYVATTRAMYSLHLTFEGKEDTRKSVFSGADRFLDYIPSYLSATEYSTEDFAFINTRRETRKVLITNPDEKRQQEIKKNLAFVYQNQADCTLPLKSNVTASLKLSNEEQPLTYVMFDEQSPDIAKGNVAHKILELLDFAQKEQFNKQVELMVNSGLITKEQVESVNLTRIENALKNTAFDLIEKATLYREKQFLASVPANFILDTVSTEQVVVQGIIDLLAIDKDGAFVFDYKYSSLDDKSLVVKYKKQLDLYAYAVEKVLKVKVKKKVIVNLFTGSAVQVD